ILGIRKEKFYKNDSGRSIVVCGEEIASPIGPAAGPNSQLAQNIIAAYLAGARFIELKTVQIMDGEELRKAVAKPCINACDEGYNVEWSTELTVQEAFGEYVKAWFAMQVLAVELGISPKRDFAFNMSVGYDLKGIQSPKIDSFIEGLKDASSTDAWRECKGWLSENLDRFKRFKAAELDAIESRLCDSITLSTLHGCPPDEIERISRYLMNEKGLNVFVKCNPTLLGYETARDLLDRTGYGYMDFTDHHFKHDLQYGDGVEMLKRLQEYAGELGREFGVKLTNTFPVNIKNDELPGEEMYMSGRSLFPLTVTLATRLSREFDGSLQISYSGGADFFNIESLIRTGIQPISMATTILKPGGYERLKQIADRVEPLLDGPFRGVNVDALDELAKSALENPFHKKEARPVGSRKTDSRLPLFDCAKAPCQDGGCPINQQVPVYLRLVDEGRYDEAFETIAIDNSSPAVTGTICDHQCQHVCVRLDYEHPLEIREMKKVAVLKAQDSYTSKMKPAELKTKKRAAIIGAGPTGVGTAIFLRRNGMEAHVFEKRAEPYGIVKYAIPDFRIGSEMISRDYDMAVKAGVEFEFGEERSADELRKAYDYVVIATGAWGPGVCPVKEGGDKVLDALAFLQEHKERGGKVDLGETVAIIGGGDVAMDCARAARRTPGVKRAIIVYRRTRAFMPAEPEEIRLTLEDGVELIELLAPVNYDGSELVCERMRLGEKDESGRRGVVGIGEMVSVKADSVIGATGATVDQSPFKAAGIALDPKGRPVLNEENESSVANIYVAGDCKAGPATVVKGIADAKTVAKSILGKEGISPDFAVTELLRDLPSIYRKKGVLKEAVKEHTDGSRCLDCGEICEICCDVCPNRANVLIVVDGKHQILHLDGMCNECGNCGIFCPHTGDPYRDKVTLFWTEEDFEDSENTGFYRVEGDLYKVRREDGSTLSWRRGDPGVSGEMTGMLNEILDRYPYYVLNL
ncbi:MAG: putative selenate reductase subunit YgfK, partial [Synergistota bacterium]|nr:putative selenate reductase subunit YgfK [Synergistota bacterium]